VEFHRSGRPDTVEVVDFIILCTKDLLLTYVNQDPSWRVLQHQWTKSYKNIQFCSANAVKLELPADFTIGETVNISRFKKYIAD